MGSTGGAAAAVRLLEAGVAALADVDIEALSDGQQLALLRVVHPVVCRMEAQRSRVIGSVHRRGAVFADGAVSTAAWLRSRLRMSDGQAQLRAAAAVRGVPELECAYAAGQVSYAQVSVVAAVLPDIAPEVLAAGAGKLLAEQATQLAPGPLRHVAARIRDHFDPEAAERRARQCHEERWLSAARTFDGAVAVQGVLDPDGGELLLNTLTALMPPPVPHDPRTPAHRRADALLDLCRRAANQAPQAGGEKPHVTVTIDWETLRGSGTAMLGSGTPVTAETARRLACDATIIPAVLGGAGEPLDLGRAARLVSTAQRRAIVLRDQGCRFPGCDRPPQWTDAHHLVPWANGGPTDLDNLVSLCRWHHSAVHEGGWTLHLDTLTNTVTATRPDGQPLDITSQPRSRSPGPT
jgi:Domain of unknown function (DUF222)/HNH endonuclease